VAAGVRLRDSNVGEKSGNLDETLKHYALQAREDYVRAVEAFGEWLPRVLYAIVCLYVIYNIFKLAAGYANMLNSAMSQ